MGGKIQQQLPFLLLKSRKQEENKEKKINWINNKQKIELKWELLCITCGYKC